MSPLLQSCRTFERVVPLMACAVLATALAGCAENGRDLLTSAAGVTEPSAAASVATTGALQNKSSPAAKVAANTPPPAPVAPLPAAKAEFRAKGLDALAAGDFAKAEPLLRKALDAKSPDWRTHSALGVVLASTGKQQEAQLELAKALALAPEHPSVLNNLALSYALDGKPDQAEQLLRRVAGTGNAGPKVNQNLALVVAARGQHDEAKTIAGGGRPESVARANADYLRSLGSKEKKLDRSAASSITDPPQRAADVAATAFQLGGPRP